MFELDMRINRLFYIDTCSEVFDGFLHILLIYMELRHNTFKLANSSLAYSCPLKSKFYLF